MLEVSCPIAGPSAGSEAGVVTTSGSCWGVGSFTYWLVFLEYCFPVGLSIMRLFPFLLPTLKGVGLKAVLSLLVLFVGLGLHHLFRRRSDCPCVLCLHGHWF